MAKTENKEKLRGWQQEVIDAIENHEELRNSEQYQQYPGFHINRALGITICLTPGSGHTFLARYIFDKYATAIIYTDMKHYREFESRTLPVHEGAVSETISMHEIFYAMNKPDVRQPCDELTDLNRRIAEKEVIVVDKANKIPQTVKDYLYNTSTGIVIMLG